MEIRNWKLVRPTGGLVITKKSFFVSLLAFAGAFFVLPHSASALVCNDQADGNWNSASTWSCGTTPGSGDDVTIDSHTVTLAGNQSVRNFSMSGGTFNMSSFTLSVYTDWTFTAGTLNAGTSTLSIINATHTITPGSATYYNLELNGYSITISGTMTVSNNLTYVYSGSAPIFVSGTVNVAGNVTFGANGTQNANGTIVLNGSGSQTLTSSGGGLPNVTVNKPSGTLTLSGTIGIYGNWTNTSGTIDAGTSTLSIINATHTITPGSATYYNLELNGYSITISGTMTVSNNLTYVYSGSAPIFVSGTVNVAGNVTFGTYGSQTANGTIVLNGSGGQTISSSGGEFPNVTIDKPSGKVTLSGTIPMRGNWTHTKGTIDPGSSTLSFVASSTFTPGSASYNNITLGTGGITLTVSGTATVLGDLTKSASSTVTVNTGTFNVYGNVSLSGTAGMVGTGVIQFGGSGDQSVSSVTGTMSNVIVNKPSGSLSWSGTLTVTGNWTWMAGVLVGTGQLQLSSSGTTFTPGPVEYYDLKIGPYNNFPNITISGTATVLNNLNFAPPLGGTTELYGGAISLKGNLSTAGGSGSTANTTVLTLNGTGDQTISDSGSGAYAVPIVINKPSGTVALSGTIGLIHNWTWTAGKLNAGTSTIVFRHSNSTKTFTPGNVTYYNFSNQSSSFGIVNLGGNLTVANILSASVSGTNSISTQNYAITVKDITIASTNSIVAGSSIIKVSGNISGTGTFTAGTSTVVLNGTNQTISGTRTYYNLSKLLPDNTTDTLTFTAGTTYTIASGGTARFIGTRGYPLAIQSSSAGSAFTLTKTGSVIAEYVSLKDCTINSATSAVASTNVSGNTNWTFTKEFVSTIRASGGDYTTLSAWESALGTVDLTAAATKVFSHGGITGAIPDNSAVTGFTSGATGTAIHVTTTQILIKSITGTFQSGEQIRVDVSNYVTSSDTGNGAIAVAEAYNDWPNALNDSVTISGETTDADNFILITVPATQQHQGKLKDTASSYYRGFTLKPSASTAIVLDNQVSYTRIEGVAIDGTNATATNIRLNGTSPIGMRLISAGGVDGFSLSGGALVLNSLAYDGTGKCFEDTTGATTNYTVYNSTARGCAYGFHGNNTTTAITLKNCLASGNSTADYALTNTGSKSVTYSASSDATADDFGTTTGDRVSQTFTFVDATNKDFHLAPKDAGARNYGLDLISDSTYPVIKDIDNDVRPAVNPGDSFEVEYDMGMDEADYDITRFKDGVKLR